ncbi:MAG: hypothetical protein IJ484_03835 [Oscillospiraceae bacterium]|nr:hypothetical protein [Oscillospiraceae bacterium]
MDLKTANRVLCILYACILISAVLAAVLQVPLLLFLALGLCAALVTVSLRFFRCPHCGQHLGRTYSAYCPHCGERLP